MKNKTLQMQVASPCSQDWSEMKLQGAGRHCSQCERVVIDFTDMTDADLLRLFQQHQGKLCGRFREDQLNREIPIPPPPPQNSYRAMGALLSGLLLAGGVSAQTTGSAKQEIVAVPETEQKPLLRKSMLKIEGTVTDSGGEAIIGANVVLKAPGFEGTVTDVKGYYYIMTRSQYPEATLTVSYIGYESTVLKLNLQEGHVVDGSLNIVLNPAKYALPEVVVVERIERSRDIIGALSSIYKEVGAKPIPAKMEKEEPVINVYPNPFVNHCQVDMIVPATDAYLFCVYNANEQLLYSEAFQLAKGRVNVGFSLPDGLPAASYWLRITRGTELLCTRQLLKQ